MNNGNNRRHAPVVKENFFFDLNIPLEVRRERAAMKCVLLVLFKGTRYANRWRAVNFPRH